ncbi:MAG TPA: helix-turn-helix transcriptional regulator [Longimicrobiales bacterium]|nr:helix-turn-helix transcriptional regulator [Longimicrobiales bacterium]
MASRHGITAPDAPALERVLESLLNPLGHPDLDAWRSRVARDLKGLLGADMTSFQLPWPGLDLLYTEELDPRLVRAYTEQHIPELARRKRYNERIVELGVGNFSVFWGHDLPWFYRSKYYNECLVPMRAFDPVWAAARTPGSDLPAVLLSHHDRSDGRRFGERELQIMRLLRPALCAAVAIVHRVEAHRRTLLRTVDSVTAGVLLCAPDGRVIHRNPAAARLLAGDPEAADLLGAALAAARSVVSPAYGAGVHRTCRTRLAWYRVDATRLPDALDGAPATLVLIERERRALPTVADVQVRWRVTRRQAQVAVLLVDRKTNTEIAAALNISENTARHHTEAVMLALGVTSRRKVAERLAEP